MINHRQNFTGVHIQHHQCSATRAMSTHHSLEFPVSQVLQSQIDTELKISPGLGITNQRQILDDTAAIVLQHPLSAALTAQPLVVGQLYTFLAAFIDIREAHHMGSHLSGGVIATVFLAAIQPGNPHGKYLPCDLWLKFTSQVNKLPCCIRPKPLPKSGFIDTEQSRDVRQCGLLRIDLRRVRPDSLNRCADRQRLAVAIRYNPPVGIDTFDPYGPHVALLSQELVIHDVQINQAPRKGAHNQKKYTQHSAIPPGSKPGSQSLAP